MRDLPRFPLLLCCLATGLILALAIAKVLLGGSSLAAVVAPAVAGLFFLVTMLLTLRVAAKGREKDYGFIRRLFVFFLIPFVSLLHFVGNMEMTMGKDLVALKVANFDLKEMVRQPAEAAVMRHYVERAFGVKGDGEAHWTDFSHTMMGSLEAAVLADGRSRIEISGLPHWGCTALATQASQTYWTVEIPAHLAQEGEASIGVVAEEIRINGTDWYSLEGGLSEGYLSEACEVSEAAPIIEMHFTMTDLDREEFVEMVKGNTGDLLRELFFRSGV